MRGLLGRLRRAERLLRVLPPRDPRQDLDPDEAARAEAILAAIGAEAPEPLDPEDAAWFHRFLAPRLTRWAAYAVRLGRWRQREEAAYAARTRRLVQRRLNGGLAPPPRLPGFSEAALRAFERLGLLDEEEAAEAA
ncbi:MAG: hypothetical protein IRZ04_13785 [Rhodospirillales bacterium]|nr:hypothetical protein [Rhodospirillales bacterium]